MKKKEFNATVVIASISSIMAITASVGFTGYFSFKIGIEHSIFLATLSVMFAVSLDLMKPLALHSAFNFLTSLHFIKGLLCLTLAFVAVIYSLTSGISLLSMTRGDLIAKRESAININKASQETYERWKQQLKQLPASRSIGELKVKITKIESLPGILINGKPCGGVYNGIITKTNCPNRSKLLAELAREKNREKLEELITDYQKKQSKVINVKHSDPGSESLALILMSLFGLKIDPRTISSWLPIIGVLGLELASSLSVVLVKSFNGSSRAVQVVQPPKHLDQKDRVGGEIINELVKNNGSVSESERGLAKRFKTSKATIRRAIETLTDSGTISAIASRNGTKLSLLA